MRRCVEIRSTAGIHTHTHTHTHTHAHAHTERERDKLGTRNRRNGETQENIRRNSSTAVTDYLNNFGGKTESEMT